MPLVPVGYEVGRQGNRKSEGKSGIRVGRKEKEGRHCSPLETAIKRPLLGSTADTGQRRYCYFQRMLVGPKSPLAAPCPCGEVTPLVRDREDDVVGNRAASFVWLQTVTQFTSRVPRHVTIMGLRTHLTLIRSLSAV